MKPEGYVHGMPDKPAATVHGTGSGEATALDYLAESLRRFEEIFGVPIRVTTDCYPGIYFVAQWPGTIDRLADAIHVARRAALSSSPAQEEK